MRSKPAPEVSCIWWWLAGWGPSLSIRPCRAPPHPSAQTSLSPSLWLFPSHLQAAVGEWEWCVRCRVLMCPDGPRRWLGKKPRHHNHQSDHFRSRTSYQSGQTLIRKAARLVVISIRALPMVTQLTVLPCVWLAKSPQHNVHPLARWCPPCWPSANVGVLLFVNVSVHRYTIISALWSCEQWLGSTASAAGESSIR